MYFKLTVGKREFIFKTQENTTCFIEQKQNKKINKENSHSAATKHPFGLCLCLLKPPAERLN